MKKIKVLVVDDSALVREVLSRGLALDPEIEVVGTASNPYTARDKIVKLRPDVLTLDVELPGMDGVEFLRRLMAQYPLPVVMVSAMTGDGAAVTMAALEAGAVDFVTKPGRDMARGLTNMLEELRHKIKIAAAAGGALGKSTGLLKRKPLKGGKGSLPGAEGKLIAIGASTGGVQAIRSVLSALPSSVPGVVVVQHMPPGFTARFANNLNQVCPLEVREAQAGDQVAPGRVLIAPGNRHMTVRRSGDCYVVDCREGEKVCGHRPSVEVLFRSVAGCAGPNAIGIILTGMGNDGAGGMLEMRRAGARTLAQDQATSVVFGMPRAAFECGGVDLMLPLESIPQKVLRLLTRRQL